jgi:hypothetical protein
MPPGPPLRLEPPPAAPPAVRWWTGWPPLVALPAAVLLATPAGWPRWAFMWLLAFAIYCGCKWLTWRRTPTPGAPWWRHAGYLLAWPGLDARAFLDPASFSPRQRPVAREWLAAAAKTALGVALFFGVARLFAEWPLAAGWVGMAGVVLALHFGSFHLLSCFWRSLGVDAKPLMNRPLAAAGVSEFWGRRWNTAFRDLAHRFLFRPLTARLGPRWGLLSGFAFSGWVHDLVISVPAGGGYGGPTAFFLAQAGAAALERSRAGRRVGLGAGWRGRLFTATALLLPAPILFHPPFVRAVVLPFLADFGAL